MKKGKMLYEGKAKRVYEIEGNDDCLLISYKDDATAFNGLKKGQIDGKGVINNRMANFIFKKLEEVGINSFKELWQYAASPKCEDEIAVVLQLMLERVKGVNNWWWKGIRNSFSWRNFR